MDSTTCSFTPEELDFVRHMAISFFKETNSELQLPGTNRHLTHNELVALSWLNAANSLFVKKGLAPALSILLHQPTSEPDTEGV